MRLGLAVSFMCALSVVAMALLAYATISKQLDARTTEAMDEKLGQIRHSLTEGSTSVADLIMSPHGLRDQIAGHDNYALTILDTKTAQQTLMSLGSDGATPTSLPPLDGQTKHYLQLKNEQGHEVLAAYEKVALPTGEQVHVVLSVDPRNDIDLLTAYLRSTLLALPLILVLVGGGGWWIVHRALKPLRAFRKVAAMVNARELSPRMRVDGLPEELRNLARAINFMLHRLDTDVQHLAQFSDDLAHELRSPINNLMGKAQVTLSRDRSSTEYKQVLESCTEELDRLSRMVSQMLFLASVSQPTSPLPTVPIDLEVEAAKVSELFSHAAEEKQMTLRVRGSGKTDGDRLMIQRAISNLVSNAIRHGTPGTEVTLDVVHSASEISFTVTNRGKGIASEHLPRIFDRFYRVDGSRSRQQGGTGLGLAIVRSIMSVHSGHVSVESTDEGPTAFTLVFTNKR
jgi:two-component system heavy metal sensor histidine kinase CusS